MLKDQERAGKKTRLPAQVAQDRAERLQQRVAELNRERLISPRPPEVRGGALIVPVGLMRKLKGEPPTLLGTEETEDKKRIELIAMKKVMEAEEALDRKPRDVSDLRGIGYDIESRDTQGSAARLQMDGRRHCWTVEV